MKESIVPNVIVGVQHSNVIFLRSALLPADGVKDSKKASSAVSVVMVPIIDLTYVCNGKRKPT